MRPTKEGTRRLWDKGKAVLRLLAGYYRRQTLRTPYIECSTQTWKRSAGPGETTVCESENCEREKETALQSPMTSSGFWDVLRADPSETFVSQSPMR